MEMRSKEVGDFVAHEKVQKVIPFFLRKMKTTSEIKGWYSKFYWVLLKYFFIAANCLFNIFLPARS